MPDASALFEIIDYWLPESTRLGLLREAGLSDDRPFSLRRAPALVAERENWVTQHRFALAPLVLRHFDPPDNLIARLVEDGDIKVPSEQRNDQQSQSIVLSGFPEEDIERASMFKGFALTQLTASSITLFQLFVDISAANQACGLQISPPNVKVRRGSMELSFGSGLFASGVGLIVACATGLVGAPLVSVPAGFVLASAGVIDLVIGWRKSVAEEKKAYAETLKTEAERRLAELEIQIRDLELQRAKLWLESRFANQLKPGGGLESGLTPPESSSVPRRLVQGQAEQFGMTEAYANHLLNRTLPGTRLIKQKMAGTRLEARQRRSPKKK
jgi:hypothetical protein